MVVVRDSGLVEDDDQALVLLAPALELCPRTQLRRRRRHHPAGHSPSLAKPRAAQHRTSGRRRPSLRNERSSRMSAITAALRQLDDVAAEGDLAPDPLPSDLHAFEAPSDPIVLPDGKRIYPPLLH